MPETYTLPAAENFTRELDGRPVGLCIIRSKDGSCTCAVTNYGARIVSLLVPDRSANPIDIVLGYPNLDSYLMHPEDYMGAIVGRCANRIAAGLFVLDGETCILPTNDGPNTLHGGNKGLNARVWTVVRSEADMLTLAYRSTDGEEGFPGNLEIELVYQWLDNNTLQLRYHATTDRTTLVNLSNHAYFNLNGEGAETVLDHELEIAAQAFTPVNDMLIPTGDVREVKDTPFDFRSAHSIRLYIGVDDEQLRFGKGYDHNYVLSMERPSVRLRSPLSGVSLNMSTDQKGMQFYSGNFLNGTRRGKSGRLYGYRSAVALEPQGFPDAVHHPQFPSVVLRPGEVYYSVSDYEFGTS